MSPLPRFEPRSILEAFHRNGVDYVLIGGLAAVARQSPYQTGDVDVCPSRRDENLMRLARALTDLDVRRVTDLAPEGAPVNVTPESLKAENELAFMSPVGPLDVVFVPMGTRGYDDLVVGASTEDVQGIPVAIASLDDLIRMKDARGLAKDRLVVDLLRRLKAGGGTS